MHVKLASIVPDYVPPSPEKMEEYNLSDVAAAAAAAAAADAANMPKQPAPQPQASNAQTSATVVSDATQTSRANTSHGPPTPTFTGTVFNLADEARRLKHEDRCAEITYRCCCCCCCCCRFWCCPAVFAWRRVWFGPYQQQRIVCAVLCSSSAFLLKYSCF